MALTDEEERALEYQRAARRRLKFGRFLQSMLKAPPEHARRIKKNFEPLRRN